VALRQVEFAEDVSLASPVTILNGLGETVSPLAPQSVLVVITSSASGWASFIDV
jgi:hypothetical protein